jgi:hypothetical protein
MSVVSAELKNYRSSTVSEAANNGGLMSDVEVISGVSTNLFSNASSNDRANGATYYRKMFMKVANLANETLIKPRIWQDSNTPGMDRVTFFPCSQRFTQGEVTGVEAQYGMGLLSVGIVANAISLIVEVESGPVPIFRNGSLIRISDKANPFAVGNEAWVSVDQAPVVNGNLVTLHVSTPIPSGFLSGSKVSSVYEAADIKASVVGMTVSSSGGSVPAAWQDHVTLNGIGAQEQNWALNFTSPTAFDIYGDTLGLVGYGNTSGATPPHMGMGQPFFTLLSSLFVGTFVSGDTITFTTHPAATPIMLRRVIPAGSAVVSGNKVDLYMDGEAA